MPTKPSFFLFALLLSLSAQPLVATGDWPTWRGPNHDLTVSAEGLFEAESFGLETVWSRDLGSAYSGIVVAGHRVITFFAEGESDFLAALDAADGKQLWRYRVGDVYKGHDGSDDGALSTPAVHGDKVFGLGPWGELFALRLEDGQEIWAKKLTELGARKPYYGFTTHPTMIDGVLVVESGGKEANAVTGFDPDSGKVLWTAGEGAVEYQAPMALDVDGQTQVLAVLEGVVLGLEPRTGKELWSREFPSGDDAFAQPIPVGPGQALLTDWQESALLSVSSGDDGPSASEVWRAMSLRGSYAIPVPYKGHLYGYSGNFLTCIDAASGEMVWKSREPGRGGHLIVVDSHMVIFTETGELVVAEASAEGFAEKARAKPLESGSLTAPSFAGGRFYVRNLKRIASLAVTRLPADR